MHALLLIALLSATTDQNGAPAPASDDLAKVEQASDLISHSKPADAIALLEPLISAEERSAASDTRQHYCARSPEETMIYSGMAAEAKRSAVVLERAPCYAIFLKGFALIDLNRSDEAPAYFERAIAMAPLNAQFLAELAEWYKNRRDWAHARPLFQRALDASEFSPPDRKIFDKTRGLRGLGYILIEEGKLDEAERLYRKCLELDRNDDRSKRQLDYIAGKRAKNS